MPEQYKFQSALRDNTGELKQKLRKNAERNLLNNNENIISPLEQVFHLNEWFFNGDRTASSSTYTNY